MNLMLVILPPSLRAYDHGYTICTNQGSVSIQHKVYEAYIMILSSVIDIQCTCIFVGNLLAENYNRQNKS